MIKPVFDEEGFLDEPCLSCDNAYLEDIWNEWCCDEKTCPYKAETEGHMKYAEEIIKEIKNRETIDTDDYLTDDGWEEYIRGKESIPREKHKPCINYEDECEE